MLLSRIFEEPLANLTSAYRSKTFGHIYWIVRQFLLQPKIPSGPVQASGW
jgi:hypothetical protein